MVFGIVLALLALAGGLLYVLRLREKLGDGGMTDDLIRQIEQAGRVEIDEPLDLDEIAAEEDEFWEEERWDGADEF